MLLLPLCIEGSKGSGKTTTIRQLAERLVARGIETDIFAPFAVADNFAHTQGFNGAMAMSAASKEDNRRVVHFILSSIAGTYENIRAKAEQSGEPAALIYDRGWMTLQPHLYRGRWFEEDRGHADEIDRLWGLALHGAPATAVLRASLEVTRRRRHATLTASGLDADNWLRSDLAFRHAIANAHADKIALTFDTGETPQDEVVSGLESYVAAKLEEMRQIQSRRPKKKFVALYGGSFNLPTVGHKVIGLAVRDLIQPDAVWYLVSPQNPHKSKEGMATFHHRLEMSKINVCGNPRLVVTDVEKDISEQTGTTYTDETLRELIKRYPDTHFAMVLGADTFAKLHTWHHYEYILKNASLIVVPRTGYTEAARHSPAAAMSRELHDVEELRTGTGWYFMDAFQEGASSATMGRERLREGKPLDPQLVKPEVQHYAREHAVFGPAPV